MNEHIALNKLKPGEKAVVCGFENSHGISRRLMDLGLVENAFVECVGTSPLGDPSAYLICGAVIAIRNDDAKKITVGR